VVEDKGMNKYADFSLFSIRYQSTLRKTIEFELRSFIGRAFFNQKPNLNEKENFLNLGCGLYKFKDWLNADFYPHLTSWLSFKKEKSVWYLDLRYPFNCDDNVWDGVFCEHTLEHLFPQQAADLLKELYRTMKTDAWLRLSLPDLRQYIAFYRGKRVDRMFSKIWQNGAEAMRSLTQNFGHLSVWDDQLLAAFLQRAGFKNIREVEFRQGSDKRLLKDSPKRKWESFYLEAQKK
jgi:hypothetical protein